MKKYNFISIILVCIIAISLIVVCKAIYEDEDSILDILCSTSASSYEGLFIGILLCLGILYDYRIASISPQSIMAYLARYEKSPPVYPSIFATI